MIIILEGPDGSGKTTLAKQLAQQTGYDIVHMSAPKTPEEKADMAKMYAQAIEESDNVIFDRCWYSELVYGPLMREGAYVTLKEMDELEYALSKKGALIIHCTGDSKILWHRCTMRGEDYIVDYETFEKIHRAYNILFNAVSHKVPVVEYEYKGL